MSAAIGCLNGRSRGWSARTSREENDEGSRSGSIIDVGDGDNTALDSYSNRNRQAREVGVGVNAVGDLSYLAAQASASASKDLLTNVHMCFTLRAIHAVRLRLL